MKRSQFFKSSESDGGEHHRQKRPRTQGPRPTTGPEIEITASELPLIPQGVYEAVGVGAVVIPGFKKNTKKLAVEFSVMVPEDGSTVKLYAYYNLVPGPGGRFRVGKHSKFRAHWVTVAGRRPTRGDRLSPSIFRGVLMAVNVRTVVRNSKPEPLPDDLQYSVIDGIVEVKAGGGRRD